MNKARLIGSAAAVAITVLLVTSCSGSSDTKATDTGSRQEIASGVSWPEAEVSTGLAKGMHLPIEPYLQTYPQTITMQRATDKAVTTCMKRFGIDWDPPQAGLTPPATGYNAANIERRYGITNTAEAEKDGYHAPDGGDGEPAVYVPDTADEKLAYDLNVPDGQSVPTELNGEKLPENGCASEARRLIGALDDSLAENINIESFFAFREKTKAKGTTQKWVDCFKGKGYNDASPMDAINNSGRDTAKAVADVACKKSTDLVAEYIAIETTLQDKAIAENRTALDDAKARNEALLKKAEEYLAK
ncbi:hypothetical protein EES47_25975 [Streptomyces sp. ADI98-12]|nr:hypothetical protein EES47_25975 [Streptomyces sp. ADI98-12]